MNDAMRAGDGHNIREGGEGSEAMGTQAPMPGRAAGAFPLPAPVPVPHIGSQTHRLSTNLPRAMKTTGSSAALEAKNIDGGCGEHAAHGGAGDDHVLGSSGDDTQHGGGGNAAFVGDPVDIVLGEEIAGVRREGAESWRARPSRSRKKNGSAGESPSQMIRRRGTTFRTRWVGHF